MSPRLTSDAKAFFLETRVSDLGQQKLTNRQRGFLQLLAEGSSMKEAAYNLQLTVRTIAFHKYKIMKCLRLRTSAQLVQYAIREHVVWPRS
jgi:DNA-binding NarL/FixJ family response regulator